MNPEYKLRPDDFTRRIIATGSAHDMVRMERSILRWVDAANNPLYYNKSNGGPLRGSTRCSPSTRAKISKALKGRVKSKEHLQKLKNAGLLRAKPTMASRKKMSEKKMGKKLPIDTCIHCGVEYSAYAITRHHNDNCKNK